VRTLYVTERSLYLIRSFNSEPVKRSKNRSDVTRFWGSGDSTSKRILDVLESFCSMCIFSISAVQLQVC